MDHGCGRGEGCLEVFRQPAIAAEPGEGALDQPAFGKDGKAMAAGLTLDDLEPQPPLCCSTGGGLPLVAAIGEDQTEPGKAPAQAVADQRQPVAVLLAVWITTTSKRPSVSTRMWRLRPLIFLPAS